MDGICSCSTRGAHAYESPHQTRELRISWKATGDREEGSHLASKNKCGSARESVCMKHRAFRDHRPGPCISLARGRRIATCRVAR